MGKYKISVHTERRDRNESITDWKSQLGNFVNVLDAVEMSTSEKY